MMICTNCSNSYEDGASFCRDCGAPLVPNMNAPQGGAGAAPPEPARKAAQEPNTVSIGEWIWVLLLPLIPCVGWLVWLVMMFVWGFGETVKPSKKTFARASLIVALVAVVLVIVLAVIGTLVGISLSNIVEQAPYYQYRYHYYF